MATRFVLTPNSAEFPTTGYPSLSNINGRPAIAFDAGTVETCYWTVQVPQGWTGTITAVIQYIMASAITGNVDLEIAFESVTPDDALDLDATTSFDTANGADETVPGTAGYMSSLSITVTNNDSSAAGDYLRVRLERDADDATNDTATGDCYILGVEIRDGA